MFVECRCTSRMRNSTVHGNCVVHRLGNHPLPGLMASGRFATSLASNEFRFPAPAYGGRRLRSTALSGRLRRRAFRTGPLWGAGNGASPVSPQAKKGSWSAVAPRPYTVRARLTIQVNRPLLRTNTRHAQRLRSCTSCPAGKPYNRSRLRFYIRASRGWSPSRHPPEFFLRKELRLQLFP
jgi:hypothetical protein